MKKIKVRDIINNSHKSANDIILGVVSLIEDAEVIIKVDDLLKERNLSQKDLAQMTNLRTATISEFINGKGTVLNKSKLLRIMVALQVTKIDDIIEIRLPESIKEKYILNK
ncbi:putative helix-turn-helix transcriptional regulator [Bacillus phage vB_BspM_Internexus]|nr:putative helix-turn-helix transcriptional regulator [Bacillus phage vB_BspM_Internexus]